MTRVGPRGSYGSASAASYVSPRIAALDAEANARLERELAREHVGPGYCVHGHDKHGRRHCLVCHREAMRRRT